jgi:hypothetical protein
VDEHPAVAGVERPPEAAVVRWLRAWGGGGGDKAGAEVEVVDETEEG